MFVFYYFYNLSGIGFIILREPDQCVQTSHLIDK